MLRCYKNVLLMTLADTIKELISFMLKGVDLVGIVGSKRFTLQKPVSAKSGPKYFVVQWNI